MSMKNEGWLCFVLAAPPANGAVCESVKEKVEWGWQSFMRRTQALRV